MSDTTDTTKYQNADQQAHLAYFDIRTQASFVWDGRDTRIQVCLGGYGEPVDHTIAAPFNIFTRRFDDVVQDFQREAQEHAATLPDYGSNA